MTRTSTLTRAALASLALVALAVSPARAQNPQVAALKSALEKNAAAQRSYTWVETTQLALNGEVKSTTTSTCQYLMGQNKPACTPTSAPAPEEKKRGVRGHVVEKKTDEYKAYMDSVKTLIGQYVPPKKDLIAQAEGKGGVAVAPNQPGGAVKATISNYLEQGDNVAISFNPATNALTDVAVNSWLNDPKATVTLAVQFMTLPSGVTFASQKVLTATAKGIVVTISSSNFAQAVAQ
jgi:hypothetical protein